MLFATPHFLRTNAVARHLPPLAVNLLLVLRRPVPRARGGTIGSRLPLLLAHSFRQHSSFSATGPTFGGTNHEPPPPASGPEEDASGGSSVTEKQKQQLYLHVSPSGDWWTGDELFAAKHLQPDYVRSVLLLPPAGIDDVEEWLDRLGDEAEQVAVLQGVYDEGKLPDGALESIISEKRMADLPEE